MDLSPRNIILKNDNIDDMKFLNLFFASWDAQKEFKIKNAQLEPQLNKYNITIRDTDYISPEQLKIGRNLVEIAEKHNSSL